ncbi:MAG: multicopper oxidase domain-containing protein [Geobacteraceae bacterium]|nr:multicopper oxidase domain-containing protein [Geobacteraceae bacterium]NTW79033.1 multicopper oxidase domain-containing protein [Geobacteraceae bacterium]
MKTKKTKNLWISGLIILGVCFFCIPRISGAVVYPIPTNPLDAHNGIPDYYTTANWANSPPLAKFVDALPGLGSSKANLLGQYLTVGKPDITTYPGSDYYEIELVEFRQRMHSDLPATTGPTTGATSGTLLRGYKQVNNGTNISSGRLPSENKCGADLHVCSAADTNISPEPVRYLGPTIITERDRPVRVKFINSLPTGSGGNLFVPVDESVMGAGKGPLPLIGPAACADPLQVPHDPVLCGLYTQNRANIHLHGGRTPWISDGTPHQWITPAGETTTPYKRGVSVQNVPDMEDPGSGANTYYFTNQQSARLMFYHDHAFGITRLNVYVGEAAGYLITDQYEKDLVDRGIIPSDQIPLIIQDKTFVDATTVSHPVSGLATPKIRVTDPLWNWGSGTLSGGIRPPVTGDLWMPHVYMPAQNPLAGSGGVNPFGRWMYGPLFYPATSVEIGLISNPYYDERCSSSNQFVLADCEAPGQPDKVPGTPNVSMGMEAFQDVAVVNGTAFPTLSVDPRAYRFRILNAASDRFWNLSFYQADPAQISPDTRPASRLTEVKMLPASAELAALNNWPADWPVDGRDGGVPDPAFKGPSFLQIGTEGGFLPAPTVREPQPVTYITDPTAFWVGVVDKTGLALGPAERADVIVDFSAHAGKTLILYNDAPAAWPARVPGYDYYTGAPDMRDSGGYGTGGIFNQITGAWEGGTGPLVGYAPNTRTIMQVIVRPTGSVVDGPYTFDKAKLEKEFTSEAPAVPIINPADPVTGKTKTLFERAQEPIIVGQPAYSTAYPDSNFPINYPWEGVSQINDNYLKFVTLAGEEVIVPMHPKGIHDEQGASFDPVYGRMSGNLAMQLPNPTTLNALLVLYGFSDLPTETINNSTQINVTVGTVVSDPFLGGTTTNLADGTQIWKISHNGVDTHPIHFHIFDVQLINRVGWDGQIALPEANELGWKDTIKISPLMDTIVAVRPRAPALPFGIPNSIRPLNPAIPLDSTMGFNSVDWQTGQARLINGVATPVTNILYNFGWEYVWHCHILSHEEMDMMRPIVLQYEAAIPDPFTIFTATQSGPDVVLNWDDRTPVVYNDPDIELYRNPKNEIGFNVYRSTGGAFPIDGTTGKPTPLNPTRLMANKDLSFTHAAAGVHTDTYMLEAFNAAGSRYAFVRTDGGATVSPAFSVAVTATGVQPFASGAGIPLVATISGLGGVNIDKVEFFDGSNFIGSDAAPQGGPYELTWNGATVGTHSITARVHLNLGGIVTSAPLSVTITGALTASFTSLTTPGGTATPFTRCDDIQFTSTSTAATGSITGSRWLINGKNYTTNTVTTKLPPGIHSVTLAVENSNTGEIAQVTNSITVTGTNAAPTATVVYPGATFAYPAGATTYTVDFDTLNVNTGVITGRGNGSLTLNGTANDTDACDVLSYAWDLDNKNGFEFFTASTPAISYNALKSILGVGSHTMRFVVTDLSGLTDVATATIVVNPNPHDGIIVPGGVTPSIADALSVFQHVAGINTLSATQQLHADVAPLRSDGTPLGNGVVDIADVIIILRRVIGATTW